jgi:translation initiation factor 4G
MPLTAGMKVADLNRSETGWKPPTLTSSQPQQTAGHMAPDMVQRKVKAALNKMTPEKFDKISDQILEIAAQSKDESDGRTLRQVNSLLSLPSTQAASATNLCIDYPTYL